MAVDKVIEFESLLIGCIGSNRDEFEYQRFTEIGY
ncbi:hypothetical protein N479_25605 [Pseudoalteromonas luteoviolacea S4054]|uniref:Uncharacterized protein n=1 Tax=Pseudoalteromonas luteoviolacea S4054 TaxID=1129367 RepID=A0A0F6AIR2_9GAMM|nr:hypothetical protein N479_25605 [Pseudoalteromonas luteoviolacea S4054]